MIHTAFLCITLCSAGDDSKSADRPLPLVYAAASDGSIVQGVVRKNSDRHAILETDDQRQSRLAEYRTVRFAHSAAEPAPTENFRIRWSQAESIAANPLAIDPEVCRFRHARLGNFEIPVSELVEIETVVEGAILFQDRFESETKRWRTEGSARTTDDRFVSPPQSARLDAPGQSLTATLAEPAASGRIQFWFYDAGTVADLQWDAQLLAPDQSPLVTIGLGWKRSYYTVDVSESLKIPTLGLVRSRGWRLATIEYSPDMLTVAIDGAAAASSYRTGVDKPIAAIRFGVGELEGEAPESRPAGWIDDVLWTTAPEKHVPLAASADRTQLLDRGGDEWFGRFLDADDRRVRLELSADETVLLPWSEIRLARFPSADPKTTPAASQWRGEIGRLELVDGSRFVAVLDTADDLHWTVDHPLLGSLEIDVSLIARWTPIVRGRRTVVLRGPFHLGRKVVPGFRQPSPQGETLELEFENDPEATATALSVWVRGMEPQTRLAPFEHALQKGALRTEVWLNGKNVDYLNRHLESAADAPTRVRLPIPAEFLQEGANRLELRLTPDPSSGTVDESEASDLAIEHVIDEGE